MRRIVLLLLFFYCKAAYSQFVEKVFLKDSTTVYEGWIIEQVPQDYVKILRFKERDTLTIQVSEIWKIARTIDVKKINSVFKNPLPDFPGRHQAVFVELLGTAGVYSLNYDTRLKKGKRNGWGARLGFSYLNINDSSRFGELSARTIAIPVELNYLFGKRRSALELGIGITYVSSRYQGNAYTYNDVDFIGGEPFNITSNGLFASVIIGYRYRSVDNGFLFRLGFMPIVIPEVFPAIGVSFGYSFKRKK